MIWQIWVLLAAVALTTSRPFDEIDETSNEFGQELVEKYAYLIKSKENPDDECNKNFLIKFKDVSQPRYNVYSYKFTINQPDSDACYDTKRTVYCQLLIQTIFGIQVDQDNEEVIEYVEVRCNRFDFSQEFRPPRK